MPFRALALQVFCLLEAKIGLCEAESNRIAKYQLTQFDGFFSFTQS